MASLSQKGNKKNSPSLVDGILQHTPDLDIHQNGNRRGFAPIILDKYPNEMDVPSMNTVGDMISLLGLQFTIH